MDNSWEERTPPDAARVAARTIVLSAVTCRGMLEFDDDKGLAEKRRRAMCGWLEEVGAAHELEDGENLLIRTPIGQLKRQEIIDAVWQAEGMFVLGWSLGRFELLRYDEQRDPFDIASSVGFLSDRSTTVLEKPSLRRREEIAHWANTYLTIHWRLRQHSIDPAPLDFEGYVSRCTWGPLTLAEVDLIEGDLAVRGKRIDRISEDWSRTAQSIAVERHKAFNWLLGFEPVYSEVSTDT